LPGACGARIDGSRGSRRLKEENGCHGGVRRHPHAFYLYIALYRQQGRGLLGKLMRIPGMRTLAGMLVVLLSKHQAGILVLKK
jgi:hypothetical protein